MTIKAGNELQIRVEVVPIQDIARGDTYHRKNPQQEKVAILGVRQQQQQQQESFSNFGIEGLLICSCVDLRNKIQSLQGPF